MQPRVANGLENLGRGFPCRDSSSVRVCHHPKSSKARQSNVATLGCRHNFNLICKYSGNNSHPVFQTRAVSHADCSALSRCSVVQKSQRQNLSVLAWEWGWKRRARSEQDLPQSFPVGKAKYRFLLAAVCFLPPKQVTATEVFQETTGICCLLFWLSLGSQSPKSTVWYQRVAWQPSSGHMWIMAVKGVKAACFWLN